MKNLLQNILTVFFLMIAMNLVFSQSEFVEDFNTNPFIGNNPVASIDGAFTLSPDITCPANEYGIATSGSLVCQSFPNSMTMTGNFLTIDNGTPVNQNRIVYQRNLIPSGGGDFRITYQGLHRDQSPNVVYWPVPLQLSVVHDGITEVFAQTITSDTGILDIIQNITTQNGISQITLTLLPVGNAVTAHYDFGIDNIGLENICTDPVVDYHLENELGEEKDKFCVGEEVFLDFSNSSGYDGWWIRVKQYDQVTGQKTGDMKYTQYAQYYEVNDPLSITNHNYFDGNANFDFCPGFDYKASVALIDSCNNWVYYDSYFTIECCDDLDLSFNPDIIAIDKVTSNLTNGYQVDIPTTPESCPTTELWCLFELNEITGKYELIGQAVGPNYSFVIDVTKNYKLQRTVESPCGTFCCATIINPVGPGLRVVTGCNEPCEECTLDDCQAPVNLDCTTFLGLLTLTWDDVPGAIGYDLMLTPNDPECCLVDPFSIAEEGHILSLDNNSSYTLPFSLKCFSWSVRAICEDGESEWSEKMCIGLGSKCNGIGKSDIESRTSSSSFVDVSVYPNPFSDSFTLKLDDIRSEEFIKSYTIFNIYGKEVVRSTSDDLGNEIQIDTNEFPSGTYMILIESNLNRYSKPIVKM